MAIPSNVTTKTIQGRYIDLQGNPIAGQVKFTITPVLVNSDDDTIIIPSVITVDLDGNGAFSVTLPVTDDPDLDPTNFTYRVEEAFPRGRTYDIEILSSSTSPINLADVAAAAASGGTFADYVLLTTFNPVEARVTAAEADIQDFDGSLAIALSGFSALAGDFDESFSVVSSSVAAIQSSVTGIQVDVDAITAAAGEASAIAETASTNADLALTLAQGASEGGLSPFLLGGA